MNDEVRKTEYLSIIHSSVYSGPSKNGQLNGKDLLDLDDDKLCCLIQSLRDQCKVVFLLLFSCVYCEIQDICSYNLVCRGGIVLSFCNLCQSISQVNMAYATHENSVTLCIGDDVFTSTDHLGRLDRAKRKVSQRALMFTRYAFTEVPKVWYALKDVQLLTVGGYLSLIIIF